LLASTLKLGDAPKTGLTIAWGTVTRQKVAISGKKIQRLTVIVLRLEEYLFFERTTEDTEEDMRWILV